MFWLPAEDVARVPLALDRGEPRVLLLAVRGAHAVLALVADEVEVDAAGRVVRDVAPERLAPTRCSASSSAASSHTANGCVIHGASRFVIGVASSATRATAPPHGSSSCCASGDCRSKPYFTNTSSASSGKLVVVVGRPVVPHARRVVDHALEVGVRHRADEVDLGREVAERRAPLRRPRRRRRPTAPAIADARSCPAGARARTPRADR